MPEITLPKPLAASVGLIYATVEDARGTGRSPAAQVIRLPLATVGQLLTARHRYDELAATGEFIADVVVDLVRKRFSAGSEEAADWIGDEFASARDKAGAALDETSEIVDKVAAKAATKAGNLGGNRANGAGSKFEQLTEEFETVIDERVTEPLQQAADRIAAEAAPIDAPPVEVITPITPKPTPLQQLESFSVDPAIGAAAGGLKASGDLPLKDFDHMSGPQLRGRLRTLDRVQLVQLLDYERAHASRVGIILMLENRLTKMNAAG